MHKSLILFSLFAFSSSLHASDIRPPAVAGQFYPASAAELSGMVDQFLSGAHPKKLPGEVVAIVVPHAGYVYSGPVAAYAYKRLGKNWNTVVLLGVAHQTPVRGAAVWVRGAFKTPLGPVEVDEALAREILASSRLFEDSQAPHLQEHSLEVQLPFLQKVLPKCRIVPILMNTDDPDVQAQVGQALGRVLKKHKALLVISSDMSHYPSGGDARRVDQTTLAALERMDPDYFRLTSRMLLERGEKNLHCTWCGESGLLAGLEAAKALGASRAVVLRYRNSAEVPRYGDKDRAVGYSAVAFVRGKGSDPMLKRGLTPSQKVFLLAQARQSIAGGLAGKSFAPPTLSEDPKMNLPAAVFVTLTEAGRLRGCIGTTEARSSLLEAVLYFAQAAAFEDHRFRPVSKEELEHLQIEISILSPMQPAASAAAVVPKKQGVVVRKGMRSGLFLPTVWEQLPAKEDFLNEVCAQKAGLPADCWKDPDVKLSVFTTEVIREPAK